jgi:PEP-CTERM motif
MAAKRHVSNLGSCAFKFSDRDAICVLAALLLLGGIVYATPISSVRGAKLQDSEQVANIRTNQSGTALGSASSASATGLNPDTSVYSPRDGSFFANNRYTTVNVPEPQSLVLVGTGLLSIAGLIRRRLLR